LTVVGENINPGSADSRHVGLTTQWDAGVYALHYGVHGYDVWKSDGTAAGNVLLKDTRTRGSAYYSPA